MNDNTKLHQIEPNHQTKTLAYPPPRRHEGCYCLSQGDDPSKCTRGHVWACHFPFSCSVARCIASAGGDVAEKWTNDFTTARADFFIITTLIGSIEWKSYVYAPDSENARVFAEYQVEQILIKKVAATAEVFSIERVNAAGKMYRWFRAHGYAAAFETDSAGQINTELMTAAINAWLNAPREEKTVIGANNE